MSPSYTLAELADRLGAQLVGDPTAVITGVAGLEDATPGHLTFVANRKYSALARTTRATAILVEPRFAELSVATLRLKNPYLAFARAIELFHALPTYSPGIHPTAVVAPTAHIGANAHIAAYVVVGDHAVVGDNAVLLPHVVLYPHVHVGNHFLAHAHAVVREHCHLGDHVTLQNGVIIGCDGYGFAKLEPVEGQSSWYKIHQSGPTVLEDHVEVQANSTIDRASIGETRIKAGAKIDNLVQVGHGCVVGRDTLLCSQVGLAGSSIIGNNVMLAGQSAVAGHCTIGDGVILTARAATSHDIPPGKIMSGAPAFDNRQWLRATALYSRLPELFRAVGLSTKSSEAAEGE